MARMCFRNKQVFWYALYDTTIVLRDEYGNQNGAAATYQNPVQTYGNISPAKGDVVTRQFGDDDRYDKVIVTGDRDTPIDEYAVLWIDSVPQLAADGSLALKEDGSPVTPWDYIVRKVARGLPNFGCTVIAVSKVTVA